MDIKYENIIKLVRHVSKMEYCITCNNRTDEEDKIDMLLLGEYLRRIMKLKNFPRFSNGQLYHYSFIDVVYIIDEVFNYDIDEIIDEICPELKYSENANEKILCKNCIKLIKLADEGNVVADRFYDVYEPLLLFFAIGGGIGRNENGFISIGSFAMTLNGLKTIGLNAEPIDIYEITSGMWNK